MGIACLEKPRGFVVSPGSLTKKESLVILHVHLCLFDRLCLLVQNKYVIGSPVKVSVLKIFPSHVIPGFLIFPGAKAPKDSQRLRSQLFGYEKI